MSNTQTENPQQDGVNILRTGVESRPTPEYAHPDASASVTSRNQERRTSSPLSPIPDTFEQEASRLQSIPTEPEQPIKLEGQNETETPELEKPIMDEDGFLDERAMRRRARNRIQTRGRSADPIMHRRSLSGNSSDEDLEENELASEQREAVRQARNNLTPEQRERIRRRTKTLRIQERNQSHNGRRTPIHQVDNDEIEYELVPDAQDDVDSLEYASDRNQSLDPETERTIRSQSQQKDIVDSFIGKQLGKEKAPSYQKSNTAMKKSKKVGQPSTQIPKDSMLGQMMGDITGDHHPSDSSESSSDGSDYSAKGKRDGGRKNVQPPRKAPSESPDRDGDKDSNRDRRRRKHKGGETPPPSDSESEAEPKKTSKSHRSSHERVKPIQPDSYDGRAELHSFTLYVHQVVDYIRSGKVAKDRHVIVAGRFLSGKASKYYISQVAATAAEWTLHEFFSGLFNELFQQNYLTVIRHQISLLSQGNRRIRYYATELAAKYALLPKEPERAKVLKLWDGLQLRIRTELIKKGFSAELTDWKTIVDEGEKIQNADDEVERVLQQERERLRAAQAMVAEEERRTYSHNR
jgi:hypothetical protein